MEVAFAKMLVVKVNLADTPVVDAIAFLRLIAEELEEYEKHKAEWIVKEPSINRSWDKDGVINAKAETFEFLTHNNDKVNARTQKKRAKMDLRDKLHYYFKWDKWFES
jgi:acyl-CoA reductase-like NAD-dependent aldehyde dehydrogenase